MTAIRKTGSGKASCWKKSSWKKSSWKKKCMVVAIAATMTAPCFGQSDERIITIGSSITELVYALGGGEQVVAVDVTSQQPLQVKELPTIGYHRALATEGLLSLKPDWIIGSGDMGPPVVLEQLKKSQIPVEVLPVDSTINNLYQRIDTLADLLDREEEGQRLTQDIQEQIAEANKLFKGRKPRVLFLLAMGNSPMVAGNNTSADSLITLAGGENVAAKSFSRYSTLSAEAMLAMQPDLVLITGNNARTYDSEAVFKMLPALIATPAGKSDRIISIDGSLLVAGLGPRIGEAALKLAQDFYPQSSKQPNS